MNVSKPFIHESTNRSTDEHRSLGHARPWRVVAEEVSREQDPGKADQASRRTQSGLR